MTRESALHRDLAASERRLRDTYRAMACGVIVRDPQGQIILANEAATRLFGLPVEAMLGRTALLLRRLRSDGTPMPDAELPSLETVNYRKDGAEYEAELRIAPVRDETGTITTRGDRRSRPAEHASHCESSPQRGIEHRSVQSRQASSG